MPSQLNMMETQDSDANAPVLIAKNLTKIFGDYTAVDNVSFSIPKGSIIGFLGPNGAGKTTTIQMLLGVLTPSKGNISYFGLDLHKNRSAIMESVNFSSTYANLPWRTTIRENLICMSYLYKIPDRKKKVQEVIETFRLTKIAHKTVSNLSEGQKTRLMLAKSFINDPKVLLLDEPTASMDPETSRYVRNFIIDYKKTHDISILLTSHNMVEVEELCDEVIFLNHGKIIAKDTPYNLSKIVKRSKVMLLLKDGLKRAEELCKERHYEYSLSQRFITIDVTYMEIPQLLNDLSQKGIVYDEINIQKPSLEDFFVHMANVKAA